MTEAMASGSPLRRDQATAVMARITSAAVAVIESGAEPTMRAVAAEAQISERTIYRYYPTRDDLYAAVGEALRHRASAPLPEEVSGLEAYVHALFSTFDANARLTRALVTASWLPTGESRPRNLAGMRKLFDAAFPKAPRAERESAAATLRVLCSAAGWAYLADCGFDLAASVRHVTWVLRNTLTKLEAPRGGSHA